VATEAAGVCGSLETVLVENVDIGKTFRKNVEDVEIGKTCRKMSRPATILRGIPMGMLGIGELPPFSKSPGELFLGVPETTWEFP
jgi:hypothetical protein